MSRNNEEGSTVRGFDCFNINCYAWFKSERGLRLYLWRSSSCKDYMARQQAASRTSVDGCQEIVSTTPLHYYDVEFTRLNPGMNTDPPSHTPYKGFNYGTNDDNGNDGRCKLDNEMSMPTWINLRFPQRSFLELTAVHHLQLSMLIWNESRQRIGTLWWFCNTMLNINVQLSFWRF